MDTAKNSKSLEHFDEIRGKLAKYADDHLALRGYSHYIRHNLGAALDAVRNGGVMYDLDDRVLLKHALAMSIPSSICHDMHGMTDLSFTELEPEELRDLFIRYAAGLPETKTERPGAECGVLRVLTPLGTIKASFKNSRTVEVILEDEGRDIATISSNNAVIFNSGIRREVVPLKNDCKVWDDADYAIYKKRREELFAETEENTPEERKNSPELRQAKERLLKSVIPERYQNRLDMEELLRYTGEAYDVFSHAGSYADLCKVIALEKMLGMDVPYWMYLALMVCSDGADPMTADPADIRFGQFAEMIMNEQTPGEATAVLSDCKNRCVLINTPIPMSSDYPTGASAWQVLSSYAASGTNGPGIYIARIAANDKGLYAEPMALVEYTEGRPDVNACIITTIWKDPNHKEYAPSFVYRKKGSIKIFEVGSILLIPGLHAGDYTVRVWMRKKNVLYCKETAYPNEQPNQYRIEIDPETGYERFLAWEYNGTECFVYPDNSPENVYNGSATCAGSVI